MILFVYRRDLSNVGDWCSCPVDYFDFTRFGPFQRLDIGQATTDEGTALIRSASAVIVGGGGAFHFPAILKHILETNPRTVAWGIGTNTHGGGEGPLDYGECPPERFALAGFRDRGAGCCVPCVSCLSPLFDQVPKPSRPLSLYGHKDSPLGLSEWAGGVPERCNDVPTMREAVSWIASGETVITNSYHGAFWGLMAGRAVVVYRPFSTKFYHLPWRVEVAYTEGELLEAVFRAVPAPHALARSRVANMFFCNEVFRFLGKLKS